MATEPGPTISRLITSVGALAPAIHFYRDLLGLELRVQQGEFAWLVTADGVEVMLHERPAVPSDTAVAVGFTVTDVARVVADWAAAGGVVVDEPSPRPWGETMAVVRDADGHLVCLSER